jgi:hypothetical protein
MNISFSGTTHSIESLFQNLYNLHHLTIHTPGVYLNGYEWEKLIVNHLPKLKVFRLKMSFTFPNPNNKEKQVDQLLHSFRTHFWLEVHQWFVRYDFNRSSSFNHDIIYTLPYAFKDFVYEDERFSKSTCFDDQDFCSYDRVQILRYSNIDKFSCNKLNQYSSRFLNSHHLEIHFPFDDHFFIIAPSLYHLVSLKITFPKDLTCFQLQTLLDQAPHLYSLTVECYSVIHSSVFQAKNISIRRLIVVKQTDGWSIVYTLIVLSVKV